MMIDCIMSPRVWEDGFKSICQSDRGIEWIIFDLAHSVIVDYYFFSKYQNFVNLPNY